MKKIELLSPAGSMSCLSAAIKAGADAVYLGLNEFTMRTKARNFTGDELKKAIKLSHENGVKVYVTMNTSLYEKDIDRYRKSLDIIKSAGADAVIVSDLGAILLAVEKDIAVHVSVQANITNSISINLLKKLGVSRVILSRELSLSQIKNLCRKVNLPVEAFVHGALCVSESGRCFLSAWLYGKNANCGDCLQPCRYEWRLISEDGSEVICNGRILSAKDLCMIEYIPDMVDAGITAFKIEGRMRNEDYVYNVTSAYRRVIDAYLDKSLTDDVVREAKNMVSRVFNREFSTGFYFGIPGREGFSNRNGSASGFVRELAGEVVEYNYKQRIARIRLYHKPLRKDCRIVFTGDKTGYFEMRVKRLFSNGTPVEYVEKGRVADVEVPQDIYEKYKKDDIISPGDRVFTLRKRDHR